MLAVSCSLRTDRTSCLRSSRLAQDAHSKVWQRELQASCLACVCLVEWLPAALSLRRSGMLVAKVWRKKTTCPDKKVWARYQAVSLERDGALVPRLSSPSQLEGWHQEEATPQTPPMSPSLNPIRDSPKTPHPERHGVGSRLLGGARDMVGCPR